MKKILGIVALIILIGLIGFGFTYKMIEPDGWDRFVEEFIPSRAEGDHGNLNFETESTTAPTAEPTQDPTSLPTPPSVPDKKDNEKPKATAEPTATPTVSPSSSVTPSPTPAPEVDNRTEYEKYIDLSGAEQQKIFESYENPQEFFDWSNAAKKEYDDKNQAIIVDSSINLEDIIGKDSGTAEQ